MIDIIIIKVATTIKKKGGILHQKSSINWRFLIILFLLSPAFLTAQTQLTQLFRFESGVYLTFEEFQKNTPTYNAVAIEGNFFVNDKTKQAKVEYIRLKTTKENLALADIWGVVIKGIPYIRTTPNLPSHSLTVFASMEVRGNICYYAYDDIEEKDITFKAYNPLIGKPYRTATVKRKIPIIKEKMLRFQTGVITDFSYQNLLTWLAEDSKIVNALKSLGATQAEGKLFDALLLYNDKHPVSIATAPQSTNN